MNLQIKFKGSHKPLSKDRRARRLLRNLATAHVAQCTRDGLDRHILTVWNDYIHRSMQLDYWFNPYFWKNIPKKFWPLNKRG